MLQESGVSVRSFAARSYTSTYGEIDKLRARRTIRILILYWAGAVAVGALLPAGLGLDRLAWIARSIVGRFDGVMQAAARSFDANYIEVFAAFCLCWSVILSGLSVLWLPRGSHLTFLSWRYKLILLLIAATMLAVAWLAPEATQKTFSLRGGRSSALLLLATSSRVGAIAVLGTFWGFAQLFFFLTFRTASVSPVRA